MKIRATDSTSRERIYSLQIGNIEIRRTSASDCIEVYQDGTLQTNITAQIVDQDNDFEDHSVCKKRDIQITYAYRTTANVRIYWLHRKKSCQDFVIPCVIFILPNT